MRPERGASRRPGSLSRRRIAYRSLAVLVCLALTAAVIGYRLYVHPRTDAISSSEPADAVLVLGGDARGAWDGDRLVRNGFAKTLVLSDPYSSPSPLTSLCDRPPGLPRTICFVPAPSTTQGEAQELGRLTRQYGWKRVIVMAPAYHVSRARLIVGRCYTGQLAMVSFPRSYPLSLWVYEFAYQTGGFAKALLVKRGC